MYFNYGSEEITYLKQKDKRLADVIDKVGKIQRPVDTDLFSSVIHHIIGQQISTKAQATIWQRINDNLGVVNADTILAAGTEHLQSFGITFRKAQYITDFARKIKDGSFDLEGILEKSDEEAIKELSSLQGIGVWTAEMILLFCMQRPNIFSFGDLAILRGIRMVYHHRKIDCKLFEKYRRRFSPYCSVAIRFQAMEEKLQDYGLTVRNILAILCLKIIKKRFCPFLNKQKNGLIFISAAKPRISHHRLKWKRPLSVKPYGKSCLRFHSDRQ